MISVFRFVMLLPPLLAVIPFFTHNVERKRYESHARTKLNHLDFYSALDGPSIIVFWGITGFQQLVSLFVNPPLKNPNNKRECPTELTDAHDPNELVHFNSNTEERHYLSQACNAPEDKEGIELELVSKLPPISSQNFSRVIVAFACLVPEKGDPVLDDRY